MKIRLRFLEDKLVVIEEQYAEVWIRDWQFRMIGRCMMLRNGLQQHFAELDLSEQVNPEWYLHYDGKYVNGVFCFYGLYFTQEKEGDEFAIQLKDIALAT